MKGSVHTNAGRHTARKRKQSRRKRRERINLIELSLLKCSLRSTEKIAF